MKQPLILTIFLLITLNLFSQDLIVTRENDSINCKITKIKNDHIYFTFIQKGEVRNTLISLANLTGYYYNHYSEYKLTPNDIVNYSDFQKLRIAVNTGISNRTAKVPSNLPSEFVNYINGLKRGYHFGFTGHYYISDFLGFGLNFSRSKSSNQMDNIYIEDIFGNRRYGVMSDDIAITFMGPSLSTRISSNQNNNAFLMSLSIGYLGYNNDAMLVDPLNIYGYSAGVALDVGYDIELKNDFALGFQISAILGMLDQIEVTQNGLTEVVSFPTGENENLARIDFTIGLRFVK